MGDIGRLLLAVGALFIMAGLLLMAVGKIGLPIGRLPGDFVFRGKHTTFYFPLATCVLLSVVGSLILWLLGKLRH